ncbi:DUF2306 domain-containing protein [Nocardioides sp. SYSU DS0663]|uniref:DUF2306 domain-containing protein n=1 Tax=Nocardioides sp. SYSU DS0663 TaxID=3416445 RepID=UPI003F4B1B25
MATSTPLRPSVAPSRPRQWPVPTGLIALSLVPVVAGMVRVGSLASGGPVTPENARFFADPLPVIAHIVGATVFCLVGAFQFVPSLRRGRWHRTAGKVVLVGGLVAALSGTWMAVRYPLPYPNLAVTDGVRVVFGVAMFVSLVLALQAIRARDVRRHRAWMIRGYAIGQGAGTQAVLGLPSLLLFGDPNPVGHLTLHLGGWVVNVVVAEAVIRRMAPRH